MASMMGAAEDLITRISLQGVEMTTAQTARLGTAFKVLRGDLRGAAADMKRTEAAAMNLRLVVGAAAVALGAIYLRWAIAGARGAEQTEDATERIGEAFQKLHTGSMADAKALAEGFDDLPKVVEGFSTSTREAALSLALIGKAGPEQIKAAIPAILDTTVAMEEMGKKVSMQEVAQAVARGAAGMSRGLKRLIPDLDEAKVKTGGLAYITDELNKRYGGAAAESMNDVDHALTAAREEMKGFHKDMGAVFVPVLISGAKGAAKLAHNIREFNKVTHGAAGYALAAAAGLLVVGGLITIARPAVLLLADAWGKVAAAATAATAAQTAASAAGAGSGAAAAAVGGRGIIARIGGALGGAPKGLLAGLGIGIIGSILGGYGEGQLKEYNKSGGKRGGLGASLGMIGGNALQGAGFGAALGSVVPVVGTMTGAVIGAVVGAIGGAVRLVQGRDPVGGKVANPKDPVHESNKHLKKIADLMEKSSKRTVGGGARVSSAYNTGDVERALMGTLAKAVV